MKPEELTVKDEIVEAENHTPVAGDVIGDTAYSERFVLKILLKFANLDTLKDEIQEKLFEDDLCTLWDMTAERDVVLFLQKHDVLKLFHFALPVIESPRLIEIIIGIIGNMCCHKEVVDILLKMDTFVNMLLVYIKTDDSLILIQILRLISSSLFPADENDIAHWMDLFKNIGYSTVLYFILKNSSNKDLLITALENFNTVCSYCNTEKFRKEFFNHFVTLEAMESLSTAFAEVAVNKNDSLERYELERILVISLQITLNLVGFDKSPEIYSSRKDDVIRIVSHILSHYHDKLVKQKEIDSDLIDIIDSTNTILEFLQLGVTYEPDRYFRLAYSMWKALQIMNKPNGNDSSFEVDRKEEIQEFSIKMKAPLCLLICKYMEKCSNNNLLKVLDDIGGDYEDILSYVKDEEMKTTVTKRATNYRTRLKDNVDS